MDFLHKPNKHAGMRLLAFSFSFLVASCGGNGDDPVVQPESESVDDIPGLAVRGLAGQAADQVMAPWVVNTFLFRVDSWPGSGDIHVATLDYGENHNAQNEIDFRKNQLTLDECKVDSSTSGGGGGNGTPPFVSSGSSLVINSPSGPWVTLQQRDDLQYFLDEVPGPLPSGATLSIPGSEAFPTYSAYRLFEPQVPVRLSPAVGASVDVNSEYSWVAGGNTSVITMQFLEFDANGNFVDFLPVTCQAIDDGEFVLPIDALNAISSSTNEVKVRYVRRVRQLEIIDGILFYQRISVAESREQYGEPVNN